MLISHKHRFIFIKTHKTAGTSIEIALSRFCGPDDVITPVSPKDEETRSQLGFRSPQNYVVPPEHRSWRDAMRTARSHTPTCFFNHAKAAFIRKRIDSAIWNDYFKFCFERNPWDRAVSLYYWRYHPEPYPAITDFIQSRKARRMRDWKMYTNRSGIVVDYVYKYENMNDALADIRDRVGLPETPQLPNAKAGHRGDKTHYRDLLSDKDRERIARLCAPEIERFGYAWD